MAEEEDLMIEKRNRNQAIVPAENWLRATLRKIGRTPQSDRVTITIKIPRV